MLSRAELCQWLFTVLCPHPGLSAQLKPQPRSPGVSPNPWMPPGKGLLLTPNPTPAPLRGFTSTGGRKWVTAAGRGGPPTPGDI